MTVEFDRNKLLNIAERNQKKFLVSIGETGASLAAINSRVDTGASQNAKNYQLKDKDTVIVEAPMQYDIYLERRFGIMAKTLHQLKPFIKKFEESIFG